MKTLTACNLVMLSPSGSALRALRPLTAKVAKFAQSSPPEKGPADMHFGYLGYLGVRFFSAVCWLYEFRDSKWPKIRLHAVRDERGEVRLRKVLLFLPEPDRRAPLP